MTGQSFLIDAMAMCKLLIVAALMHQQHRSILICDFGHDLLIKECYLSGYGPGFMRITWSYVTMVLHKHCQAG